MNNIEIIIKNTDKAGKCNFCTNNMERVYVISSNDEMRDTVYHLERYVEGDLNALDSKSVKLLSSKFPVKKGTELYRGTNKKEPNRVVQSWSKSERFAKLYAKDKNGIIDKMIVGGEKTIDVARVFKKFGWYGKLLTVDEIIKAEEVLVVYDLSVHSETPANSPRL